MKRTILTLTTFLLAFLAYSQTSWQWGKAGGSQYSTQGFGNQVNEEITSMATDPHGNVYALARVANKAYVGGDSSSATNNLFIAVSWACDGRLRWLKTIGPSFVREIATDTLGGVYIMGYMDVFSGNYFDTDTVIAPQGVYKGNFIIKYDTSGQMKWLRMPDADTITMAGFFNKPHFLHMEVTPKGDVHTMAYLNMGLHANGAYPVSQDGFYIVKYNKDGNFLGGTKMDFMLPRDNNGIIAEYTADQAKFSLDPWNGRYYLCGGQSGGTPTADIYVGNDTLRAGLSIRMFAMSFDHAGHVKWVRAQDTSEIGTIWNTALDRKGRLYLAGQIKNGAHWNGSTLSAPTLLMAFAACMDSNGVNKWVSSGYSSTSGAGQMASCIAVNKDDVVRVAGFAATSFTWGAYNLYKPLPAGCAPVVSSPGMFYASLDPATGICTGLDSIRTKCSYNIVATLSATDRNGNFFLGGMLSNPPTMIDTLVKIGPDKLVAIGGDTDFFVAKYGKASCKATPSTGIEQLPIADRLKLYPNPATDELRISGIDTDADYVLYNNMGGKLMTGRLSSQKSSIRISALVAGFYFIQVTERSGETVVFKMVKE